MSASMTPQRIAEARARCEALGTPLADAIFFSRACTDLPDALDALEDAMRLLGKAAHYADFGPIFTEIADFLTKHGAQP